jgi:hypothetical protein
MSDATTLRNSNAVASARRQLVLATIVTAYQGEFESNRPMKALHFAENVAESITNAGIRRSDDLGADLTDIARIHVDAHTEWFAGASKNRRDGFLFRDYLAEKLDEAGFQLEALRAA